MGNTNVSQILGGVTYRLPKLLVSPALINGTLLSCSFFLTLNNLEVFPTYTSLLKLYVIS